MKVTAVFDIGRTNKKFFLFDRKLKEVYQEYKIIDEIKDDDGFPCDNITEIILWVRKTLNQFLGHKEYDIREVNFSAYGASMVHVDKYGKPVAPLYSYLKPIPSDILTRFYTKYGDQWQLAQETSSPPLEMLNSGLQLFWLKYAKPKLFEKVKWSLHLPQFLSYLFTRLPVSDFTSIGCHTLLWDYSKKDYHQWVYMEEIDVILAPIVETNTMVLRTYQGQRLKFGVGIHDSSSALLPYFIIANDAFLLLSTGTWNIAMNPFSDESLTKNNLRNDVLKFMQIDGRSVKASRLFLGNEYKRQTEKICKHFQKKQKCLDELKINRKLVKKLQANYKRKFIFDTIKISRKIFETNGLENFKNYEEAYHQLMLELVELQVKRIEMAIGKTSLNKIYIDGGFIHNDIFVKMVSLYFSANKIRTADSAIGSALGAAIVVSRKKWRKKSFTNHYELKKIKS